MPAARWAGAASMSSAVPPPFHDFRFHFCSARLASPAARQRSQQEAFTVTPVNDPRKLELMRCAYQLAVSSCGRGAVSGTCPDCQTRFNVFYTGDPNGDIRQGANGIVTSECLKAELLLVSRRLQEMLGQTRLVRLLWRVLRSLRLGRP